MLVGTEPEDLGVFLITGRTVAEATVVTNISWREENRNKFSVHLTAFEVIKEKLRKAAVLSLCVDVVTFYSGNFPPRLQRARYVLIKRRSG